MGMFSHNTPDYDKLFYSILAASTVVGISFAIFITAISH